jgi:hypothetical protein
MSDNTPPEPAPPSEADAPTIVANVSGGVSLDAQRDVTFGGDVVGRDKVTTNIDKDGVTISGLLGMVGIGKTMLVLVQTNYSLTLTQYGHRMSSN